MIDPADVSDWFEAHAAPLVLYARQWLSGAIADDVVQEAFVRLMSQRRPPDNVKAWLFRAVRNEAITQWRSSRRRQHREQARAADERWFEPGFTDSIDAHAAAGLIHDLPAEQRESLVLRIWGGLTLAEIATITGAPVSTVFHHYQQALGAVRKRMGVTCEKKND